MYSWSLSSIYCNVDYDVDYEHYYYTIEVVQRKVKVRISIIPQPYLPDTMSTALWRSSPNCLRIEMAMPVVLFLPLGWDQPNPSTKSTGICCGRRIHIKQDFFCAHSPPWSRRLDSPCLPAKTNAICSSFDCGRQAQGYRGSRWWFLQIWGDGLWNCGLMLILYIKQLY